MKLYYGLTNYHLLCCILHKYIYNKNEKCVFVASQGILKNRIETLKAMSIFDDVIYLEDTEIREYCFRNLSESKNYTELEMIKDDFKNLYSKKFVLDVKMYDDIYLAADHGVFGLFILASKLKYSYIEDGRGIYSNWEMLDNLLKIKNPKLEIMCKHLNAYGKNEMIKKDMLHLIVKK